MVPTENRQGPPAYISRHPNYPRGTIAIVDPHCPGPPKPSKGGGITGRGIQVLRSRCRHNPKARRGNLLITWHRTQSGQQTRRLGRKSRRVGGRKPLPSQWSSRRGSEKERPKVLCGQASVRAEIIRRRGALKESTRLSESRPPHNGKEALVVTFG